MTSREMRTLIEQGLRSIAGGHDHRRGALPVYVTVRDYEVGLSSVLTGLGFAPYVDRARFVKHTTAAVRRPAGSLLATAELRQEVPVRSQLLRDGGPPVGHP
jgi:hypothetical protein